MTAKLIRFHEAGPAELLHARWRSSAAAAQVEVLAALTLPGLPEPRFPVVDVLWGAGGAAMPGAPALALAVSEEVKRGAPHGAFVMMSVARRNPELSRAEFAERWRAEAGRLGGETIPEEVRGVAYVQNHPVADDAPVDAVNEVWFARLDHLHRRAEWFAEQEVPAELFAESWSLYLRAV